MASKYEWEFAVKGDGKAKQLERTIGLLEVSTHNLADVMKFTATRAKHLDDAFAVLAKTAKEIKNSVKGLAGAFKFQNIEGTDGKIKKFDHTVGVLEVSVHNLADVFDFTKKRAASLGTAFQELTTTTQALRAATLGIAGNLKGIHTASKTTAKDMDTLSKANTAAKTSSDQLGQSVKKTAGALSDTGKASQHAGKQTTGLLSNMLGLKQGAAGVASAFITTGNYIGGATGSLTKMGAAAALGAAQAGILGAAVVGLGVVLKTAWAGLKAIANVTIEAGKNLLNFGAEASSSRAALRAFFGENSKVEQSVERLGRETEYSQSQLSDFAIALKRAGTEGDLVAKIMPSAIEASRASGEDITSLGKTAAIAMKQFSSSSESALDHLLNLAAAGNASATGAGELKQALANAGTAANQLKISGKDTVNMLAQLGDAGISGSKAGRFLRIAFERLSAPTADASKVLQALNIDLKDLDLSNPAEWLKVFSDRLKNVEGGDRLSALKPIFGAASSAMAVLIEESNGFDIMAEKIAAARKEIDLFSKYKSDSLDAAIAGWRSAVEGLWKSASKISNPLWTAVYKAGSGALNKIADSIDRVSGKFEKSGNDLKGWIAVMKSGGLKDLFAGISAALQPELEQIKLLSEAVFEGIGELFSAAIKNIDWQPILQPLVEAGARIAEGIWSGLKKAAPEAVKGAEKLIDTNAPTPIRLVKDIAKVGIKTSPIAQQMKYSWKALSGLSNMIYGKKPDEQPQAAYDVDPAIKKNAWRSIEGEQTVKPFAIPTDTAPVEWTSKRDQELAAYAANSRAEMAKMDAPRKSDAALNIEGVKRAREAAEAISPAMDKAKLSVIDMGKEFAKWLLEPFDAFQQMVLGIKNQFTGIIDGLKGKRVDMQEKAGLLDEAGAGKARTKNAKDTFADLKAQLDLAQTAEEKTSILGQLSDQAMNLNDLTGDKSFAKRAVDFNKQAEDAAKEDRDIKLKAAEIEKKAAEDSVPVLERLFQSAGTSGEKAEAGAQLKETLMKLGRGDEAASMNQQLQQLTIEQAGEQTKLLQSVDQRLKELLAQGEKAGAQRDEQIQTAKDGVVYTDPEAAFD